MKSFLKVKQSTNTAAFSLFVKTVSHLSHKSFVVRGFEQQ